MFWLWPQKLLAISEFSDTRVPLSDFFLNETKNNFVRDPNSDFHTAEASFYQVPHIRVVPNSSVKSAVPMSWVCVTQWITWMHVVCVLAVVFAYNIEVTPFWLTWKMYVCVMSSVSPAGRMSAFGKNFNIVIFSNTINMITVKVCMMVVLIELYLLIPHSVTLVVFQVTAVSKSSPEYFFVCISPITL